MSRNISKIEFVFVDQAVNNKETLDVLFKKWFEINFNPFW